MKSLTIISSVKADAGLVTTFFNPKKEGIGVNIIALRDIEPDVIRHCVLRRFPD
jgi:hypothetical protein